MNLEDEAEKATQCLKNRVIERLYRHRKGEVAIQFTDGVTLFIDQSSDGLELSITGNIDDDAEIEEL